MFLERFGDGDFLEGQVLEDFRILEPLRRILATAGQPIGELKPGGIFARHDAGARGRADVARGVGLGEAHVFASEAVEMRRRDQFIAIATEGRPTLVVGKDEEDVGF